MANNLRSLLYIIPALGVLAYIWLRQQEIVKNAKTIGIDVKAGLVSGSASVVGVRGAKASHHLPENVKVGVRRARDEAEVAGVIYGDPETEISRDNSLEVLADIFKQLNKSDQINLIAIAQKLFDKREKTGA